MKGKHKMTNKPDTIEEQLKELEAQFQHAQNIIRGLTEQKLELEMKLMTQSELVATQEAQIGRLRDELDAAYGNACQCSKID